jgi:hypothetical protein
MGICSNGDDYGSEEKRHFRKRIGGADQSNEEYGSGDLKHGWHESEVQKEG